MKIRYFILFALFVIFPMITFSKIIQILHTNDIHSHFKHIPNDKKIGGYARLKTLIEREKQTASQEGIASIVVDAGDFMEGHLFYMAKKGRAPLRIHASIGYDIGLLGNHDYMMGTRELGRIMRGVNPKMRFLGANMKTNFWFWDLKKRIRPYHSIQIDGQRISFIGLTTNNVFFASYYDGGRILNYVKTTKKIASKLRWMYGDHLIIVLSHLGLIADKKLASRVYDVDLIIGGHSHDVLHEPVYVTPRHEKNLFEVLPRRSEDKRIPIFQAGALGAWLGKIVLDIKENGSFELMKSSLIPVAGVREDPRILGMVEEADRDVRMIYGGYWLDEKVGFSYLNEMDNAPIRSVNELWGYFFSHAMNEIMDTDAAIMDGRLMANYYPVGKITREDLLNSFPRMKLADKFGDKVSITQVFGYHLIIAFRLAMMKLEEFPFYFTSIKPVRIRTEDGKKKIIYTINGKRIRWFYHYNVAMPDSITDRSIVTGIGTNIIREPMVTDTYVWETAEKILKRGFHITETNLENLVPK